MELSKEDALGPRQVRYQAALRPDSLHHRLDVDLGAVSVRRQAFGITPRSARSLESGAWSPEPGARSLKPEA